VEFLFEQVGAPLGIPEVFRDVATSLHLNSYPTALEGSVQAQDALTVGVVQALGDADEGSETASDALVSVVERGISGMVAVGFGLAVVIAHNGGGNTAIPPLQTRDVAVQGEIFAVLVVAAVADAVPQIVQQRTRFQLDAGLNWQVVHRLQLVKEH